MQLIIAWFEVGKAKLSEKINATNIKIQKDTMASEGTDIEVTGFGSYQKEEEDTDDDI